MLVLKAFLKGSREAGVSQQCKERSEPDRPGGGSGRVNPSPELVWRFWRFGGFETMTASTRLEAQGLGGFNKTMHAYSFAHSIV